MTQGCRWEANGRRPQVEIMTGVEMILCILHDISRKRRKRKGVRKAVSP